MAAGALAGAAAVAAIAQAVKASGVVVQVEPGEFERILSRQPGLVVVTGMAASSSRSTGISPVKRFGLFLSIRHASYSPAKTERVAAQKICVPP